MREILFRGKLKDKDEWIGEWIEGIYCPCYWDLYMRRVEKTRIIILSNKGKTDGLWREVIPETVGQYTGLTDKNGKRIFEGDIVHCVSKLDSADMVIIFECGQFRMILAEKYHEYQTNVGYYDINCFAKEVIGNIHDNPELLRGENNGINR